MLSLIEAAFELLVRWTDPRAIGAAIVAIVLVGTIAVLLRREQATAQTSAAGSSAAGSRAAGAGGRAPPSTPDDLEQRAETSGNPLARGSGHTVGEMLASEEIDDTELLSRFVHDAEGEQIGETMTVTEDEVVLKQEDAFLAVDPDAVIQKEGTLLLDPNVDWDEARKRGESWREANLDRMEYDEEGLPET